MSEQIYFDLQGETFIHFCDASEIDSIAVRFPSWRQDFAVFDIDGSLIRSREELFLAFARALKMPKGWYGNEEYAPNADAFLEYLDDVHEWVPAKGHVVLFRNAESFWHNNARMGGMLVEWWQFATGPRECDIHLLFVW